MHENIHALFFSTMFNIQLILLCHKTLDYVEIYEFLSFKNYFKNHLYCLRQKKIRQTRLNEDYLLITNKTKKKTTFKTKRNL